MNTANKLTILRIIFVPVFIYVFFSPFSYASIMALTIYILAGITDFLDGFIARKYNMQTKLGTVLDPLADKLMIIFVILSLTIKNLVPVWVLAIVLSKETLMIILGILLYNKNYIIPSNMIGKVSTTIFYVSICLLILSAKWAIWFLYIALFLSFFSFVTYFLFYNKNLKNKKDL